MVSWLGTDAERWETALFDPAGDLGFVATGFQAGMDPLPYQLTYKLDVRRGLTQGASNDLDEDPDSDGLTSRAELRLHTHPNKVDTAHLTSDGYVIEVGWEPE